MTVKKQCEYCKKTYKISTGMQVTSFCSSECFERSQAHQYLVGAYAAMLDRKTMVDKYLKIIKDELKEKYPKAKIKQKIEYNKIVAAMKKEGPVVCEKRKLRQQIMVKYMPGETRQRKLKEAGLE